MMLVDRNGGGSASARDRSRTPKGAKGKGMEKGGSADNVTGAKNRCHWGWNCKIDKATLFVS